MNEYHFFNIDDLETLPLTESDRKIINSEEKLYWFLVPAMAAFLYWMWGMKLLVLSIAAILYLLRKWYLVCKDLREGTKIRFMAIVANAPDKVFYRYVVYIKRLNEPIDIGHSLFYYLIKNLFLRRQKRLLVDKNVYYKIKGKTGIIELSKYSKLFLNFEEISVIPDKSTNSINSRW